MSPTCAGYPGDKSCPSGVLGPEEQGPNRPSSVPLGRLGWWSHGWAAQGWGRVDLFFATQQIRVLLEAGSLTAGVLCQGWGAVAPRRPHGGQGQGKPVP